MSSSPIASRIRRTAPRVIANLFRRPRLDPAGHRLSLLHGSGALAVDAALTSLVHGRSWPVDNGVYCRRIATTLAEIEDSAVDEHDAGIGQPPRLDVARGAGRGRGGRTGSRWSTTGRRPGLLNPLDQIAAMARASRGAALRRCGRLAAGPPGGTRGRRGLFNSNSAWSRCRASPTSARRRTCPPAPRCRSSISARHAEGIPYTPERAGVHRPRHRPRTVAAKIAASAISAWRSSLAADSRDLRAAPAATAPLRMSSRRFGSVAPIRRPDRGGLTHGSVIYAGQDTLHEEIFRVANIGITLDEAKIDDLFRCSANQPGLRRHGRRPLPLRTRRVPAPRQSSSATGCWSGSVPTHGRVLRAPPGDDDRGANRGGRGVRVRRRGVRGRAVLDQRGVDQAAPHRPRRPRRGLDEEATERMYAVPPHWESCRTIPYTASISTSEILATAARTRELSRADGRRGSCRQEAALQFMKKLSDATIGLFTEHLLELAGRPRACLERASSTRQPEGPLLGTGARRRR